MERGLIVSVFFTMSYIIIKLLEIKIVLNFVAEFFEFITILPLFVK